MQALQGTRVNTMHLAIKRQHEYHPMLTSDRTEQVFDIRSLKE
jgi:hypothetical protein